MIARTPTTEPCLQLVIAASLALVVLTSSVAVAAPVPTNPRTEYLVAPLGVDVRNPRLSWELLAAAGPAVRAPPSSFQTSYRVTVTAVDGGTNMWDSGVVQGQEMQVTYAGKNFTSDSLYSWTVAVADGAGATGAVTATFHTGLLAASDWSAMWVSSANGMMRKPFAVKGPLKRAVAFATAEGYHEFYLNGAKVR